MAAVSELDIIRSNPIEEGLSAFRRRFESTRADPEIVVSVEVVQDVFSTATTAGSAPLLCG
jgi:hypothetical protein